MAQRRLVSIACLALLLFGGDLAVGHSTGFAAGPGLAGHSWQRPVAPLQVAADPAARIAREYLVLFQEGLALSRFETHVASLRSALLAAAGEGQVLRTFTIGPSFRALHVKLAHPALLNGLRRHPDVKLVEENQRVGIAETCHQQKDAPWNLGRIDTHELSRVDADYSYEHTGANIDVYIVDTGILTTHVEFEGRAEWGANFANDSIEADCNGHGTHVAGIVAGRNYGVAKNATVIAVKVFPCGGSGSWDAVISGVQWVVEQAAKRRRPAVANMSLSGGRSATANAAIAAAVDMGVTVVVAAGNEYSDACSRSPAMEPKAIAVAATFVATKKNDNSSSNAANEKVDRRADFSNFGPCVSIGAPGKDVRSAWINEDSQPPLNAHYKTLSGTSMASPHVAGVAALILSRRQQLHSAGDDDAALPGPVLVRKALEREATRGVIDLDCADSDQPSVCRTTPNLLLFSSC